MRRLDDTDSAPITVRLPIAERAALVAELARTNENIETEQWLNLTSKVTASQAVRVALRMFWVDWLSCKSAILAYYAARVTPKVASWVPSRLLFAMLSNEASGFASIACSQSKKYSSDESVRPLVYCGWSRHENPGITVLWGVVPVPVGVHVTLEDAIDSQLLGLERSDDLFRRILRHWTHQFHAFGRLP